MTELKTVIADLPAFDRNFWDGTFRFTRIGTGALGGKASGLAFTKDLLAASDRCRPLSRTLKSTSPPWPSSRRTASTNSSRTTVSGNCASTRCRTTTSAHAFQQADLPVELLGDLRALIEQVKTPLAIRSSSLLEDALDRPFAGVYATKMIPNNQLDPDTRFRRLMEAIKFVYASTYFREARDYIRTTGRDPSEEKMAVIIQEVVGQAAWRSLLSRCVGGGALLQLLSDRTGSSGGRRGQPGAGSGQDDCGRRHGLDILAGVSEEAATVWLGGGNAPRHADGVLGGQHGQAACVRSGQRD